MSRGSRILIIEDEAGITVALYTALIKSGYIVDTAKTGCSGLRKAGLKNHDIILLDLGLPDMSGLTVCKQLRLNGTMAPIIILTGEKTVRSKVSLFDAGAMDYVTKPFSLEELQARIRACLRPSNAQHGQATIHCGELTLDPANRSIERQDMVVGLTRKEYAIIEYLMQNAGHPVTRSALLQYAWHGEEDAWTNTIDVHIKHLRDKLDRPFSQPLIKTVHGVGYKLLLNSVAAKT
jgi:two-component system, OmpR family, response regulator